jgi:hypothetical protein
VSGDGVPEAMAALLKIIRKARKAEGIVSRAKEAVS